MWSRMRLSQATCSGVNVVASLGFVAQPFVEPLGHRIGEGREHGLLFQREADERDEVGEASGLRAALHFPGRGGGEGVPQAILGPGGVVVAELLLQFLEHRLGEALLVRAAVEDLQRGDLGLVLLDVVAERSQRGSAAFSFAAASKPWLEHGVDGDGVDRLLGFLLGLGEGVAQRGHVERGAGFVGQVACARPRMAFGRDFGG